MCLNDSKNLLVGVDVGSTTVKVAVVEAGGHAVLFERYVRHHAHQAACAHGLLSEVLERFGAADLRVCVCGSGGQGVAELLGAPFVQEVVANSLAVKLRHSQVRCAIELGGQDAKMIFFAKDAATGALTVRDMRMNGSCAGGTGAFIDEIAALIGCATEEFEGLAAAGTTVYDISGRCGVFAKTDIQPLLNQGTRREDIALSAFHAIAKQTIGGLAQGLDIEAPIIFEGGPLTFNPTLVRVFCERLGLAAERGDVVVPEHPETMVAFGAALALEELFAGEAAALTAEGVARLAAADGAAASAASGPLYFECAAEEAAWRARHALPSPAQRHFAPGTKLPVFLGIDSGSTTTKLVFVDEAGALVDSFYGPNEGDPVARARAALIEIRDRWAARGVVLDVRGFGSTGYGEHLFAEAFGADVHAVETVAHAQAALACEPNATFVLDIGGQDMKALWLDGGIISDIVVNEACSSGCGSFLEAFAATLGIPVHEIASAAFRSQAPAQLGSRCTVFMNSSIVSEQRCGKTPDDIMAGLCRSIIQNIFTKVVRVPNLDALGEHIVVQGGTFLNDAVLRAFEQHVGREVTRAPHPGLMGALGVAAMAREAAAERSGATAFIGLAALDSFTYEQSSGHVCPFCGNGCNRTVVEFSNGARHVTGNRCVKGEVLGEAGSAAVREAVRAAAKAAAEVPDLFRERERLLFKRRAVEPVAPARPEVIGLPRVLALWENAPFWLVFWEALGFETRLSAPSSRALFERGLPAVPSDTVCFPAKLVHGAIRDLAAPLGAGGKIRRPVSRIFMPSIAAVPTDNASADSVSMCAVVKGYPLVLHNSDNPAARWGVPLDAPLFYWYSPADRDRQLCEFLEQTFGVEAALVRAAIEQADAAQAAFQEELREAGRRALEWARERDSFAVVLAARPYHNDALVNHELSTLFTEQGVAVLCADALEGVGEVELDGSRLDVVNNFHARMLASAVLAARSPEMEYAQLVSFGCGHDAYLSDEIIRLSKEAGGTRPLILKVDESDARGPLRIRVRSFVETVRKRRQLAAAAAAAAADSPARAVADSYHSKFTRHMRAEKTVLVPNTSHAFCRLMTAAFRGQGLKAEPLEVGREEAIALGKKYVHNDICFPAQMVVGEALAALESGQYDPDHTAIATGKYIGDCRLTHYAALLRRALDDAGFSQVPIITNDDRDARNIHPGFRLNTRSAIRIATALPMIDALEQLLRKMRPYETVAGAADAAFNQALDLLMAGLERSGVRGAAAGFKQAVAQMATVQYDRSQPKPRVLIVGEYLLNFHPGANRDIERYLERNGLEVIEASMTDVIRKTYFFQREVQHKYHTAAAGVNRTFNAVTNAVFEHAHSVADRIGAAHPLYEAATRLPDLARGSEPLIPSTFDAGEGILIPGEIVHHANRGCEAFIILQPFGCLPNHVVGRGISKRLKEMYPSAQILPLDYDPDVSFANLENRLQMLIMNLQTKPAAA